MLIVLQHHQVHTHGLLEGHDITGPREKVPGLSSFLSGMYWLPQHLSCQMASPLPWPSAPAGWNAAPALFHWLFSQDPGGKSKILGTQLTSFSSYLQVFSTQIKMPESSGSFVRPLPFETTGGRTCLSGPKPGSKCLGSL